MTDWSDLLAGDESSDALVCPEEDDDNQPGWWLALGLIEEGMI